ncbi:MAG: gliding motility-associated C-terminal domain-containing protein [Saprospiraceae bacterium]|nr:gliding motility-associated C-terminal domain-containing protein [Candidatus Vicinibacter affinis]
MKNLIVLIVFLVFTTGNPFEMNAVYSHGSEGYRTNFLRTKVACDLRISKVVVGDCEYGIHTGNRSKVLVAVFLEWTEPIAGSKIQVSLKGQTKLYNPFMKGCPPYVQFILDPDGGTYVVDAEFVSGNCKAVGVNAILPVSCDPPICSGVQSIGGKVYSDYNNNGVQDISENGKSGIEIRLYNDNKQLVAITKTMTEGKWSVNGIPPGTKLRVEFQVPIGLFDAIPGPDNHTRTQISTVGNCNVSLGVFNVYDLIDENPWIVTSRFTKGNSLDTTSPAFIEPAIIANRYNTTEGGPRIGPNGNYHPASAGEVGAVWGLAYQKQTGLLYSSAFLKRQSAVGPAGLGAIYYTDLNGFLPNPPNSPGYKYYGNSKLLLNLDDFGIETGDENLMVRNLPLSPNQATHDSIAFDLVGKWGMGDLDINDNGDTLYAVNLHNRSLIVIAIGNPLNLPITVDRVKEIPIPDPGCSTAGDWRPWGLKFKYGKLYVGGVCSAESSQKRDDLKAIVYTYENGAFTEIVSFDLNYIKGSLYDVHCNYFRPWTFDFYGAHLNGEVVCGPVPILSDIEFDSDGNMILALGDRYGYQTGGRDYGTKSNDNFRYLTFAGGDVLRLFQLKGNYLLEQNATSGFYTTLGANNSQGICDGEFYYQDGFSGHQEGALGALAVHPSYNTVLSTLMDPSSVWSNGWSQLDNSNGTKKVNYNIFSGENGTFGKSSGLGDIELLIGSSQSKGIGVSVGNYIWSDADQDGVQDPGELPLEKIPVQLYDSLGQWVKGTFTDAKGLYYFYNLEPSTLYYIQLGADTNYVKNVLVIDSVQYVSTTFRSRINFGNSENDSDASKSLPKPVSFGGKIVLDYKTGQEGENDFSLDFGLHSCYPGIVHKINLKICMADSILVGNVWFSKDRTLDTVVIRGILPNVCDSILEVNVELLSSVNSTFDTVICAGENLTIGNMIFDETNSSGSVTLFGANQYGCDSIISVHVGFHPIPMSVFDTSICKGGKLIIGNITFDELNTKGLVRLPGTNQYGCDSLVLVQLLFYDTPSSIFDTTICSGESFKMGSETFDEKNRKGIVMFSGAGQYGCDSTVLVNVSFYPIPVDQVDTVICRGKSIMIGNTLFDEKNQTGRVVFPGVSQYGCDSVANINLSFYPIPAGVLDTTICYGQSISIGNTTFNDSKRSGTVTLNSASSNGCDSVLSVNLKFYPEPISSLDTAVCPGEKIIIAGKIFDENTGSGKVIFSGAGSRGCDSLLQVNLKIRAGFLKSETVENCKEYTWPVNGITYRKSEEVALDYKTKFGCDSVYRLKLTILPEYTFYDTLCVFEKYFWPATNEFYEESGSYISNLSSSQGCDSLHFLYLLIRRSDDVWVPNVFSPNGDGVNDKLSVFSSPEVKMIDNFMIFDRWGENVFSLKNFLPNDPQLGWDGNFRGRESSPAVYVYLVEWRDKANESHKISGDATLVR